MDVYENVQAGDVINPVGEAILSLVAAIRTGNDVLKNAILLIIT